MTSFSRYCLLCNVEDSLRIHAIAETQVITSIRGVAIKFCLVECSVIFVTRKAHYNTARSLPFQPACLPFMMMFTRKERGHCERSDIVDSVYHQ